MIKKLFIVCAAFVWTIALVAQNISVVNSSGNTKLYRTLQAAIEGADPNSVIYLPGGGFPIADSVKITKKLTIIGIGHKSKNDNVDGNTTISGNLFFNHGSDGSALIGCYVTGRIHIAQDGPVDDMMVKCCSLGFGIDVSNPNCKGTVISQNYIRDYVNSTIAVHLGGSEATIKNNVIRFGASNSDACCIGGLGSGEISNNILYNSYYYSRAGGPYYGAYTFSNITTAVVRGNILINKPNGSGTMQISGNMCLNEDWGDDPINIEANSWDEVFVNFNSGNADPASDFHFKDEYKQYENQVGIYAGDGFNDNQTAPVPYIVAKKIDEQTDASGKLNIKIRVKAGE
ncbi:MAG: hypothetical protein J6Y59_00995 [Bacteroidaceae bacterium]|nr:hypothetical protein [Bacteroidaceae bacterium]